MPEQGDEVDLLPGEDLPRVVVADRLHRLTRAVPRPRPGADPLAELVLPPQQGPAVQPGWRVPQLLAQLAHADQQARQLRVPGRTHRLDALSGRAPPLGRREQGAGTPVDGQGDVQLGQRAGIHGQGRAQVGAGAGRLLVDELARGGVEHPAGLPVLPVGDRQPRPDAGRLQLGPQREHVAQPLHDVEALGREVVLPRTQGCLGGDEPVLRPQQGVAGPELLGQALGGGEDAPG